MPEFAVARERNVGREMPRAFATTFLAEERTIRVQQLAKNE
jgi:hypothetical protein